MPDPDSLPDYYAVLGVPAMATLAEIKIAFRREAGRHHPDRGGQHARIVLINAAWEVLSDPVKRSAYDAERAAQTTAPAAANEIPTNPSPPPDPEPPSIYSWKGLVLDVLNAEYDPALSLGWRPPISNSRSGGWFVVLGMLAGVVLGQLLYQLHSAAPHRLGSMAVAFTNLVFILSLGPRVGAVLHWLLRRILQVFYADENDRRS